MLKWQTTPSPRSNILLSGTLRNSILLDENPTNQNEDTVFNYESSDITNYMQENTLTIQSSKYLLPAGASDENLTRVIVERLHEIDQIDCETDVGDDTQFDWLDEGFDTSYMDCTISKCSYVLNAMEELRLWIQVSYKPVQYFFLNNF